MVKWLKWFYYSLKYMNAIAIYKDNGKLKIILDPLTYRSKVVVDDGYYEIEYMNGRLVIGDDKRKQNFKPGIFIAGKKRALWEIISTLVGEKAVPPGKLGYKPTKKDIEELSKLNISLKRYMPGAFYIDKNIVVMLPTERVKS